MFYSSHDYPLRTRIGMKNALNIRRLQLRWDRVWGPLVTVSICDLKRIIDYFNQKDLWN